MVVRVAGERALAPTPGGEIKLNICALKQTRLGGGGGWKVRGGEESSYHAHLHMVCLILFLHPS